jgi:hypothetical protein
MCLWNGKKTVLFDDRPCDPLSHLELWKQDRQNTMSGPDLKSSSYSYMSMLKLKICRK